MKKVLISILLVVGVLFGSVDVFAYGYVFNSGEYYKIVKTGDLVFSNSSVQYSDYYKMQVYDISDANPEEFELVGNIGTTYFKNIAASNGSTVSGYAYQIDFSSLYDSGLKSFETDTFILYDSYSGYGDGSALYPVYEPTVSIECDKDSISYGETSKCSLKYETTVSIDLEKAAAKEFALKPNCISSIEFNYNSDAFTVSNYSSSEHLKKTDNTFSILDTTNSCSCTEENVLMTFDVTLASEEVETTDLKVAMEEITFSDVRGSAVDSTVSTGNINVNKNNTSNPSTFSNIEIIIAIVVIGLSSIGIYYLSRRLNMEKIN